MPVAAGDHETASVVRAGCSRARWCIATAALSAVVLWALSLWYFRSWIAHNDFALFRLRLEMMLGGDVPLVGAHSRLGVFHPGPLREWVFVGPYWLSGRRASALPATALVLNLGWSAIGLIGAWRLRGRWIGALTAAGLAVVVVAMGDAMASPWNPFLAVVPLFVACSATVMCLIGARRAWIVAVCSASFAAQLHASALVVAGVLFVIVMVAEVRRPERVWWRAPILGAALWIGPILDLARGGDSNLVRLVTAGDGDRVGFTIGLAHLARLLSPPFIIRGTVADPFPNVLSGWSRLMVVAVVCVLVVGIVRASGSLRAAAAVALATLAASAVTIAVFVRPAFRYLYAPLQGVALLGLLVAVAVVVAMVLRWHPSRSVGGWMVGAAIVMMVVATVGVGADDHETAGRRALAVEDGVVAVISGHRDWTEVWVVNAGTRAANVAAELADVAYRHGVVPHSDLVQFGLDEPSTDDAALVAAMGAPRECLLGLDVEVVADGVVPSVDEALTVFAFDRPDPAAEACLAAAAD